MPGCARGRVPHRFRGWREPSLSVRSARWMAVLLALNACYSSETQSRRAGSPASDASTSSPVNHSAPDATSSAARDSAADSATRGSERDVDAGSSARAHRVCNPPVSLEDAGPHVRACTFGRAFLECTFPGGGGCLCISDAPSACRGCAAPCQNRCGDGEYAVSCGGPPLLSEDGGETEVYQQPPAGCAAVSGTPAGNVFACCPCE